MKWWVQLQTPQELHQPSAHEMLGSATDCTSPHEMLGSGHPRYCTSQVLMKCWDQLQTPQELHQPSAHEMLGSATDTPDTSPGTAPAKCS